MREQSHIDDMREAIRGDIERAKARRPSIFERPSVAHGAEAAEAEPASEVAAVEPAAEVEPVDAPSEPERRPGLVARLLRR